MNLLLVGALVACNSTQSVLSLLSKQKYDQAQEKLDKAIAKDSLPVGPYYAYSLLYADSAYTHYSIDTAYDYIQQAITAYPQLEDKQQQRLYKQLALDTLLMQTQRRYVDSLAYDRATAQHNLRAYQFFIDEHTRAPQLSLAITNRNQLAYDSVQQVDTYLAYKDFMETYPKATQFSQAQQRYNSLAFQELTRKGDLNSYLNFLKNYPRSPYRTQAEQSIFEISTADNQLESYAEFARQYSQSPSAQTSVNILFHLYTASYPAAGFLQDFPHLPFADSVRQVIRASTRTLAPVLEEGRFGFIDTQGNTVIDPRYDYLPADYLCEGVRTDFLHAGARENRRLRHSVLTYTGAPVFSITEPLDTTMLQLDDAVSDLGMGLLEVSTQDAYSVQHKSGYPVVKATDQIEEVVLIPSDESALQAWQVPYQFLKFRVGEQWGVKSFSGRTLLEPAYASVEEYGPFVVLERDGRLAVTNRTSVLEQREGTALKLNFVYNDVALLEGQFLLCYQKQKETVLDAQLQTVVPLSHRNVVRRMNSEGEHEDHWLLKQTDTVRRMVEDSLILQLRTSYDLYPPVKTLDKKRRYRQAFFNDRWLALQDPQEFVLLDYYRPEAPLSTYDSVRILGEHFVITYRDTTASNQDSTSVLLSDGTRRAFARRQGGGQTYPTFQLLRTKEITAESSALEYLQVNTAENRTLLLNPRGEVIYEGAFDEARAYPQGLLAVRRGRNTGMIDSTGQVLLEPLYEGMGNYQAPGSLTLFRNKRFGLFQYPSATLIEPTYESALTQYSLADSAAKSLFVAKRDGKYGVITATDELRLPFAFDRVVYWNDTSALVKAEGEWMLYRLSEDINATGSLDEARVLYRGIEDFSFFREGEGEQLLRFYAERSYGVLSNRRGEILPPVYDGILLFGDPARDNYLFFTEKYVPEAQLHVMVYLNAQGEIVKRLPLAPEQYNRIYCEY